MYSFVSLENSIVHEAGGYAEGSLLHQYFKWSTNYFRKDPESDNYYPGPFGDDHDMRMISTIQSCNFGGIGLQKYNFTKIAVVSKDPFIRGNASLFFKDYVFKQNMFEDYWSVDEFQDIDDLFSMVKRSSNQSYCFALNFIENQVDNETNYYDYNVEFSFNKGMIPDTNSPAYDKHVMSPDIASFGEWVSSGVTVYPYISEFIARYIQMNIVKDRRIINQTEPLFRMTVGYAPMTTQRYIKMNPKSSADLSRWYPFFLIIIELIPFYYLCSKLASEKENKAREGMKMMGLPLSMYYLTIFIFYLCIVLVTSIIVSTITCSQILQKTQFSLFFYFCMVYSISFYGIALVITAILPNKRSSSVASTLYHIVSYYLSFALMDPATPSYMQYSLSLFPNLCMNQCIKQFFWQNLNTQNGAGWQQLNIEYEGYSLYGGITMMTFDCFACLFFGLYFDQVIPSEYGSAKPWNFPYLWAKQKYTNYRKQQIQEQIEDENLYDGLDYDEPDDESVFSDDSEEQKSPSKIVLSLNNNGRSVDNSPEQIQSESQSNAVEEVDDSNFERVSDNLKKQEQTQECLQIKGLRKVFGSKIAVHDTNMTMYNGQIFALLGHNGAGKTTTISMLTGLIEPTEGQAFIHGIDIFKEMSQLRKILGVCPQHNVLFDYLSPLDHLRLFASFKGVASDKIEEQVQQMLVDIDLVPQKNQLTKTLSGGQKRKLSVAIALIGDSKLVMLDEPTSGMDTASRRKLWDMLKRYKQNKIIILTTHYMDEADILGDRIAIMAEGRVVCTGSSLFLKKKFGVGYNLVISKKSKLPSPQIDAFVNSYLQNVQKMQEVSSEIQYQIPTSNADKFKIFFTFFDRQLDELGIKSYGVGITTLEEVFLKIGHGELSDHKGLTMNMTAVNDSEGGLDTEIKSEIDDLESFSVSIMDSQNKLYLFFLHLKILLVKRLKMMIRDKRNLLIDLLFPLFLIFVGLFLTSTSYYQEQEPRLMDPMSIYPHPIPIYQNEEAIGFPNSERLTQRDIQQFMFDYVIANQSAFEYRGSIPIKQADYSKDLPQIIQSLQQYDKGVYDQFTLIDKNVSYGQYYIQKLWDRYGHQDYQIACLVNSTSRSVVGSFGSYIHEVILRKYLVETLKYKNPEINPQFAAQNFKMKLINKPFPLSKQFEGLNKSFSGTNSALLMAIAWMMISESILRGILKEKKGNIKHQILISGGSLPAYWLANYIADIIIHACAASMAVLGTVLFNVGSVGIYNLFLLMVFANPLYLYALSFFFQTEEGGSFALNIIFFLWGIITPICISVMQVISNDLFENAQSLRWYFYPVPIFSLTYGYMAIINIDLITYYVNLRSDKESSEQRVLSIWDLDVAGPSYTFLILAIVVYTLLVILFEAKFFSQLYNFICFCRFSRRKTKDELNSSLQRSTSSQESLKNAWLAAMKWQRQEEQKQPEQTLTDLEQQQVNQFQDLDELKQEEINITNIKADSIPVRVHKLRKTYGKIVAVDKVSFGLEFGECFALLGISGAGKTNCFKCLTGEVLPTDGEVTINGHDVTTPQGFLQARKQIGYCPQFDTIFDGLTVKEHLEIYAALKGIPYQIRAKLIEKQIKDMDLDQFVNAKVETLSGGNKRKVSVSIAMIGNPPIVFLDEPSTGVDPQAKRFMWDVIAKISAQSKKSAVIITTHAMEEAEALCSKMGIMVDGSFKCFGSSQYIKDKYGTGYEIEFKIEDYSDQDIESRLIELGFDAGQKLDAKDCSKILKAEDRASLIRHMKSNGLGEHFYNVHKSGHSVDAGEFMRWQQSEYFGEQVLVFLATKFTEVQELEHYGQSWKLKTSRDSFSIGSIFGMFQDMKQKMKISEYSVNQTTLEQIFNNFAQAAERGSTLVKLKKVNKRKKSSVNSSQDNDLTQAFM